MSKELRELLNQLENKNKELNSLISAKDTKKEDFENITEEINVLKAKVEAQKLKDEIENMEGTEVKPPSQENTEYNAALFTKAVANVMLEQRNLPGLPLTEAEKNKISEHISEDGGYAVPEDISVKINERLKDKTDIHNLVDSEKVYTRKGARTYEKRADQTPLKNLDEYGTIGETDSPKLERLVFNLKDFAGIITIPNDLLQFAGKELEEYIVNWIVDKVRITRNLKILYGTGGEDIQGIMKSTKFKKQSLVKNPGIKEFKKIRNVDLMNVFKSKAKWIVNQDGFNYLDSLEDKMGRPYLQPNPKDSTSYIFLGTPVIEIPNYILKTEEGKVPVIFGDLKEAYKTFYDGNYELLTTNIGAGAFETNTTKTRLITKLDGTEKDKDAIIISFINEAEIPEV